MTPQELLAATKSLADEIGPRAAVYVAVDARPYGRDGAAKLSVWATGMQDDLTFTVASDDWDDLLSSARKKWAEIRTSIRAETIRKMALAIIDLTSSETGCTDAALRIRGFDGGDVASLGADACAEAERIAQAGPFSISTLSSANAA